MVGPDRKQKGENQSRGLQGSLRGGPAVVGSGWNSRLVPREGGASDEAGAWLAHRFCRFLLW